jgi:hypothetical protein
MQKPNEDKQCIPSLSTFAQYLLCLDAALCFSILFTLYSDIVNTIYIALLIM